MSVGKGLFLPNTAYTVEDNDDHDSEDTTLPYWPNLTPFKFSYSIATASVK
jgi:hypothetical protein